MNTQQTKDRYYYDCWQDEGKLYYATVHYNTRKLMYYTDNLQDCFNSLYYYRRKANKDLNKH